MRRIRDWKEYHLCAVCQDHHALFRVRGQVRWNRQHDLCFRCYRSTMDRLHSQLFVGA